MNLLRITAPSLLLPLVLPALLPAQRTCFDSGSAPVAASIEASPFLLGCSTAPTWPVWHLLTPGHRTPAPHPGFAPGQAQALPRFLVRYRCTGWLLLPVLPDHVRTMGYVIDQPEHPCGP
jgi:hypothetical protein